MTRPPIVHGSFTLTRTYSAPVARVFAAWVDVETKARWFIGPPDRWTLVRRELDLRVGGQEVLHGQLVGGSSTIFTARYHAIVPDQRLVYAYDMHVGGRHLSVSLATVELAATDGGTHLTFTEQAAFLDGEDGVSSREGGTAAHLDRLGLVLVDPGEIVSSRVFDAPRARVFAAFSDPIQLARWWGPKGFRNTFQTFDLRAGGAWRFVMHGPDGTDYTMSKDFVEVRPERIVLENLQPDHHFTMSMSFVELGEQTLLTWRMRFDSGEALAPIRDVLAQANEQNFDRLAAHLAT